MNSRLFQDFNERSQEVSKYFMFLKSLEQGSTKLALQGMNGLSKTKEVDSDLLKTLKASGFLLLYNLVESTMRNAIEKIFDELRGRNISYDQMSPKLKKIVLKNFKKRNHDEIFASITNISMDIINAGFNKQELFSGNLDSRKVKETAIEYGFSHSTDYVTTGNGEDLLIIKSNRNDLAHGFKSFSQVGREKSADELLRIKNKTIKYLRQILENIEQYLLNQDYLSPSTLGST